MAKPSQQRSLHLLKRPDIQRFTNFTPAHFVAKHHAVKIFANSISLYYVIGIALFETLPNIHDHR